MKTLVNPTMIIWDVHIIPLTVYIVSDTVDALFINTVRMEDTDHEVEFRKIIYEKFAKNKTHNIIPKGVYDETIEILKHISHDKKKKKIIIATTCF